MNILLPITTGFNFAVPIKVEHNKAEGLSLLFFPPLHSSLDKTKERPGVAR